MQDRVSPRPKMMDSLVEVTHLNTLWYIDFHFSPLYKSSCEKDSQPEQNNASCSFNSCWSVKEKVPIRELLYHHLSDTGQYYIVIIFFMVKRLPGFLLFSIENLESVFTGKQEWTVNNYYWTLTKYVVVKSSDSQSSLFCFVSQTINKHIRNVFSSQISSKTILFLF